MATAEFSKFARILSAALSQNHLLGFEIAQLDFYHLHFLECQVHESRQNGSGQTRDGKSECQHSRNQRTEMDWNG